LVELFWVLAGEFGHVGVVAGVETTVTVLGFVEIVRGYISKIFREKELVDDLLNRSSSIDEKPDEILRATPTHPLGNV